MRRGQLSLLIYTASVCLLLGQMIGEIGNQRSAYTVDVWLVLTAAVLLAVPPIAGAMIYANWNK